MNSLFWKGKTVLITGHTGFKGSWLSLWLQKLGANLIGFSKSIPTKPSLFETVKVDEDMNSIFGDVCDYNHLSKVVKEYNPEIIIHMAAQAILRQSYLDPIETYQTNVMGTVNLFESARKAGNVSVILNVTSDKCYEIKKDHKVKEDDCMGGYDPYSNSKGCSELVTSCYQHSFFNQEDYEDHRVAVASVRAGNVIGGGDWGKDRLIPDIVRTISNGTTISLRYPNAVRPWQYVLDPLNGYLLLIENLWEKGAEYNGGWNFGPTNDQEKTVLEVTKKFLDSYDQKVSWEMDLGENPHEEEKLMLDCSKSMSKLGWNSKINLDQALLLTGKWYKAFSDNQNMRDFTEFQIEEFQKN